MSDLVMKIKFINFGTIIGHYIPRDVSGITIFAVEQI
jgi:hypothetical protein